MQVGGKPCKMLPEDLWILVPPEREQWAQTMYGITAEGLTLSRGTNPEIVREDAPGLNITAASRTTLCRSGPRALRSGYGSTADRHREALNTATEYRVAQVSTYRGQLLARYGPSTSLAEHWPQTRDAALSTGDENDLPAERQLWSHFARRCVPSHTEKGPRRSSPSLAGSPGGRTTYGHRQPRHLGRPRQ